MSLAIAGLGTALPPHSIEQAHAAHLAAAYCLASDEQARAVPVLYQRTRVHRRGSVVLEQSDGAGLRQGFFPPVTSDQDRGPTTRQRMERYAQEAPPLALASARRALADAAMAGEALTHLLTISCTGFRTPGVDIALMEELDLRPTIARTHIGFMGCHAAVNGLRIASALVDADPQARVLMCAVELCSLHFSYGSDADRVITNALFADGAAALLAVPHGTAEASAWTLRGSGSCVFPDSRDDMTWTIGDHGFEMTLSPRVPSLIASHLAPWLVPWLERYRVRIETIASWAIHPGGPRILSAVASSLRLPKQATEVSAAVLAECGNMSSPTLLFILDRLRRAEAPRPCVALAFGPGLVVEAALFV